MSLALWVIVWARPDAYNRLSNVSRANCWRASHWLNKANILRHNVYNALIGRIIYAGLFCELD